MAFDLRAHGDQHFGQVGDFGLLCGVFQHGFALSQRGGHHEVLGAGDRHHVGGDVGTFEARPALGQFGDHVAVFDHNFSAHGLQALQMLVHRARANRTTTGQRHGGFTKTRQQRPQRQHRGAHGFDQLIRRFG